MTSRIVFLDRETIGPNVRLHTPDFPHEWQSHDRTSPAEIRERAREAEIVITNKVPLNQEDMQALPDLKLIAVAATGYDVIDIDAARARGILVTNVRGYATATVPEHVFALILGLSRNLKEYQQDIQNGKWQQSGQFTFFNSPVRDLRGAVLGIFGRGAIGQTVENIAKSFGMEVLFAGRKGETARPPYTDFDSVLARADILTLHCPLTASTRNLLDVDEFEKMAKKPLLINAGRGGLVNEAAAVAALDRGLVAGLGFDVTTNEPPHTDNPIFQAAHRHNVILTPHSAWSSEAAMQSVWDQVIENIENYKAGTPMRVV